MQNQLGVNNTGIGLNFQQNPQVSIETHIVEREDIFYTKGRNLAKAVYKDVWKTENLVDGNDYGIVVVCNGKVLGNANIQIKKPEKALKSEKFFGASHWKNYFQVSNSEIAEISALAVSQDAPSELRRPVMMMLITGLQNLCRIKGIKQLATVQHGYLVRILTKSLHLPFYKNEVVNEPLADVPDDNYWKRVSSPAIYYLEPLSINVIEACYSFLSYMNVAGVQTAFYPRVKVDSKPSYAAFSKSWFK